MGNASLTGLVLGRVNAFLTYVFENNVIALVQRIVRFLRPEFSIRKEASPGPITSMGMANKSTMSQYFKGLHDLPCNWH